MGAELIPGVTAGHALLFVAIGLVFRFLRRVPMIYVVARLPGTFAHELLHQWQRLQGRAVTREALGLHLRAACLRRNPYDYQVCADPQQMLQRFVEAGVEQQGQIWQDHVQALVQGRPLACMALIAKHVRRQPESRRARCPPVHRWWRSGERR